MMKRVISLLLCLLMLVSVMSGCSKRADDDLGAYITMYLTDPIYDFDPARAYNNEAALRVISLLYDNLFVLDENGKVKESLAKDYKIRENDNTGEYEMIITLNDTAWTDGTPITADDVCYTWRRILEPTNSFEAAALLYDIKNARAAKEGNVSIDDVAISALNESEVKILFEAPIDYDQFLLNLTSYALAPLRENTVESSTDWSKRTATTCTSGPFKLREIVHSTTEASPAYKIVDGAKDSSNGNELVANFSIDKIVLERNIYYYRDIEKHKIDKSVTPYRLIIDYTMTDEQIMAAYEAGTLFYVGDIPLSVRGNYKDTAEITDALSTHTYIPNENAVIRYYNESEFANLSSLNDIYDWKQSTVVDKVGAPVVEAKEKTEPNGAKIFAIPEVRKAMSLALNRQAIADKVVFAKAATGLIPYGVFNADSKKDSFREEGGTLISENMTEAKAMLEKALADNGYAGKQFMFSISVNGNDEVHVAIANEVKASWEQLGFKVAIKEIRAIQSVDLDSLGEVPKNAGDDLFTETFNAGLFEVAALDYTAISADAFSMLAPFAQGFTGRSSYVENAANPEDSFIIPAHISGYNSVSYNAKIEAAFAEKDIKARAAILHEAEGILLDEAAVIPVIFNQNAHLQSKELSKVKFDYYGSAAFAKAKLKDYELYIPVETE